MTKLKVTQIRSTIGRPEKHKLVIAALGLRHHQATVVHDDTPSIRACCTRFVTWSKWKR